MASIYPDYVKEINCAIRQSKTNQAHDRMAENVFDCKKDLNDIFLIRSGWSKEDPPARKIPTDIIHFLRVLGPLL